MNPDKSEETAAATPTVRVETTETTSVVRTLEIEVAADRVNRTFDRTYRDLAKRARVPGFRPGKAPRSVLEKLYGASVLEEIERALVSETFAEALSQSGTVPVAEPAIEAQSPKPGLPFRYTARVEVKPTFALPDLHGLPGRRPTVVVGVEDVEGALERLRQERAPVVEEPEGTQAAPTHIVQIDFVGRIDGAAFEGGSGQDVAVELGSDRFLPGFESQLVGARAGERREVTIHFPGDYARSDLAGKEAVFEVHLHSVRRRAVPELDDEFAKDVGDFASLEELRARVRANITAERERKAQAALQRSILDALIERTPFELPAGLVERRLERRLSAAHRELERSVPHEALHGQLSRWHEEWRPLAEREAREALLLEAVAKTQVFGADDSEVEARIERMAQEQGVDSAKLRKAYREADLLETIRTQLADEKALEYLCREAKIDEVSAT
ncbi:MAG TPA: trigger factor [Myxococcota bacterium]|nr:trigger factor [Myxococcota bacterium]